MLQKEATKTNGSTVLQRKHAIWVSGIWKNPIKKSVWDIFFTTNFTPGTMSKSDSTRPAAMVLLPSAKTQPVVALHIGAPADQAHAASIISLVEIQERSKIKAVSYILFSRSSCINYISVAFIEWFHFRLKITGGGDLVTWISPEMRENQGKARTFFYFKHVFSYFLLVWYKWIQHSGRKSAWKNVFEQNHKTNQ